MSEADDEIMRVFKVHRTVLQMLRDRGYNIEESDIELKRKDLVEKFCKAMNKVNKEALFVTADKGPNPEDKREEYCFTNPKVIICLVKKILNDARPIIDKLMWLASMCTSVAFLASLYIVVGRKKEWAAELVTVVGGVIMACVLGTMTYYVVKSKRQ